LAAKLDGRPVFEVDLPATSRAKAAIIARHAADFPSAHVVRVEIDFVRVRVLCRRCRGRRRRRARLLRDPLVRDESGACTTSTQ
jgi:hypothetical protein